MEKSIKSKLILISVLSFQTLAMIVIIGSIMYMYKSFKDMKNVNTKCLNEIQMKVHELDAGMSFDIKRKRMILGIRDIILNENIKLTKKEAYDIAEATVNECDKYESVSPILLTAIQKVESNFITIAESKKGALGLNQIWPPTGRMLCRMVDWEYNPKVLLDLKKNTRLAVLYLDILSSEYDDIKIVVAAYNGGPNNAHYWKDGKAQETKDYVKRVFSFYNKYKETLIITEA
jgi:soluble lytic murein transglycosylase